MPSELDQPRRAAPLRQNRPLTSIEAFRNAQRSCNTLSDGPPTDGTHRVSPCFAARMHAGKVARQRPQASHTSEQFVPQRYRQQQTQQASALALAAHAQPLARLERALPPRVQPSLRAAEYLTLSAPWRPPGNTSTPALDAMQVIAVQRQTEVYKRSAIASRVDINTLSRLCGALANNQRNAAAQSTLAKDELAWKRWEQFARIVNFDPIIKPDEARVEPAILDALLAAFLLYVHANVKGKNTPDPKPNTSLNNAIAVARVLKRHQIAVPSTTRLKKEAAGLVHTYVKHGSAYLQHIRDEECIGGKPWEPDLDKNRINYIEIMLIKVMWRSSHRLGEAVKTLSELTYFVRSDITFRIKGVLMEDPFADELENMTDGDVVYLEASRSKTDFAGIE
eukprot:6212684-Pleurochrysis_carterae.AAC.1